MPLSNAQIDQLLDRLIEREGGLVDHPSDPGGLTHYGISQRSYPDLDIRALTRDGAKDIYRRDFAAPLQLQRFNSALTAEFVLDWVVNSGHGALKTIQSKLGTRPDGVMGPLTLQKLNDMKDPRELLRWRLKFYVGLTGHPFIRGWINRLLELGL